MRRAIGVSVDSKKSDADMLGPRLLVSALLIPALIGLLVLDAKLGPTAPVLFILCVLIALRCGWEAVLMMRRPTVEPRFPPVVCCLVFLMAVTWMPHWLNALEATDAVLTAVPSLSLAFGLCVLFMLAEQALRFREPGGHLPLLGAQIFTVAYVGVLLCLTATLRWCGADQNGYQALGSLIVATKMGDVGAYTLGRLFGKRKMSPHLSPGKTWMGAVGAVLGGIVGAVLWLHLISGWFGFAWDHGQWSFAVLFGAVMGAVGLLGDLCESLIKRDAGMKDSAPLMPGFGGLLDLLDSILYAGPVAVLMWQCAP